MKKLIPLIIFGIVIMACGRSPKQALSNEKQDEIVQKDGAFIHITEGYSDPHRVLMPLRMATLMAPDKDVIVYMDIHSVELMVKGAKDLKFEEFESAQTYIKQILENKTPIYVCPTCLKIAGYNPDDLIAGIQLAQKDAFFNFTKGRILTFDY